MKTSLYKGIHVPTDTYDIDKLPVDSVGPYFKYLDVKEAVVLDVGAHYGTFTVRAVERGAKQVIALEPTGRSFKVLKKNTKGLKNVEIFNAAAVSDTRETTTVYVHPKYSCANTTTRDHLKDHTEEKIDCLQFKKLLSKYRPSVLKIDCEGAEYDLLLNTKLPQYVKQVYCELHYFKNRMYSEKFDNLIDLFRSQNWTETRTPRTSWHLAEACWVR